MINVPLKPHSSALREFGILLCRSLCICIHRTSFIIAAISSLWFPQMYHKSPFGARSGAGTTPKHKYNKLRAYPAQFFSQHGRTLSSVWRRGAAPSTMRLSASLETFPLQNVNRAAVCLVCFCGDAIVLHVDSVFAQLQSANRVRQRGVGDERESNCRQPEILCT